MRIRLAVLGLSIALCAEAQEFRATLQGDITDSSKATIPAATLTLKNTQTGLERTAEADQSGHYIFTFIVPGEYTLSAQAPGFKTAVRSGIALSLNDNTRLDVELSVGATTDTVTVSAEVSVLQADTSTLGAVVSRETIDKLPLKGHSSLYIYNLTPGVVGNRYLEDVRPSDTGSNVLFSANGAPIASGDIAVDGVTNTVNVGRGLSLSPWVPSTEAVAEMKMILGTIPAEYGRAGGYFTNIVIKSGTNDIHGSAYENLRNSAMDANLFFPRGRGQKLVPYGAHTFGFSVGGPIVFPKLYNGRNRSFFFFNYEGGREGNGQSTTSSVPTAKMRRGDFSEVAVPIYNPFSVRQVNGVPTRDPFPGNIIPDSLQDPVARKIMALWPLPNNPNVSAATPWVQNFIQGSKWPQSRDAYVMKFDHQFSPNHQTFTRLNIGDAFFNFNYDFDGIATPGRNVVHRPNKGLAFNDTYLISPETTLDTRIGYAFGKEQQRPYSNGYDLGSLGLPASFINNVQSSAIPTIRVTSFQGLAGSGYKEQPGYTYSLQSNLSMHRGRHLFKTGAEGRLLRGNYLTNDNPAGNFTFSQTATGGPRADTPQAGFAMASFLTGYGTGFIDNNTGVSIQNIYYGIYFQDDFRVNTKLTLNLGVRYEYETPRTERYNRTTRGFAYDAVSPLKVPGMNLKGGLLYAGVNGAERGIYNPDRNNFAPRIGFAYKVNQGTVLRGGYALSYIPLIGSVYPTGFSNQTPLVSSQDGITPLNLLSNPFPTGLLPPIGSSQGLATLVGQSVSFVEPTDRTPMFHNWQFSVQRELGSRTLIEAAYVGSRGIRLAAPPSDFTTAVNENLNQLDPKYLSLGTQLLQTVPNPFFGILSGPLGGPTIAYSQLLRPYPQYSNVTRNAPAFGSSVYHALQMKLERRMSHGLTALVAYTFSKSISDLNNPQSAYNRRVERALTDFDVPTRLTVTAAWEVPVGQKRHFLSHSPAVLDYVVGGWTISTFNTFQAGFPLAFSLARPAVGTGSNRPNAAGDPSAGVKGSIGDRLSQYFNTAAFSQPADFTFGNLGPRIGTVRSPGMNNVNVTLSKQFRITDRASFDLRASSYNFLNHPVFSAPNTIYGDASFGRVFNQVNLSRQMEFAAKIIF